jgi:hypothetical protein
MARSCWMAMLCVAEIAVLPACAPGAGSDSREHVHAGSADAAPA